MTELAEDQARAHAEAAGLRYSSDEEPGISRVRKGRGFAYYGPDESLIQGRLRERCEALAVPPAYEDVWICRDAHGHLQATGRDGKKRKTYRYHEDWRAFRDGVKFDALHEFGNRLGRARRHNEAMRRKRKLSKERLLGAVFHLLNEEALRIGNEAYAEENDSYGATTLRKAHLEGDRLRYTAKGGREVELSPGDRRFRTLIGKLSDLPGQPLFQYEDGNGALHPISSSDVNDYLEEAFGLDVTAKTFRTWAGSLAAFERGLAGGAGVGDVVAAAAERLRNTEAVARKSYVHPAIVEAVREERLAEEVSSLRPKVGTRKDMTRTESLFLKWVEGV